VPSNVKVSSSWKTVSALYTRVGGSWKNVAEGYTKIGGAWKSFFTSNALVVDHLVIAGGGSGGPNNAAGGGAGGYRTSAGTSGGGASAESRVSVAVATSYTVTIGAGGVATSSFGVAGNNSVFATITSVGGGRGGDGGNSYPPSVGGSGGGGGGQSTFNNPGAAGTANQGYAGGTSSSYVGGGFNGAGGGGGGAGAVGGNAGGNGGVAGLGGNGVSSSITGTAVTRSGGGGGGANNINSIALGAGGSGGGGNGGAGTGGFPAINGQAATVNTGGGGGGGGGQAGVGNGTGGNGGSGVVILSYPSTFDIRNGAGLTYTTSVVGSNKVTVFTAGTGNIQFASAVNSSFVLLETVTLTSAQSSVEFANLNTKYGSTYQHLQVRMVGRASRSGATTDPLIVRLSGATQTYGHHMFGNGSSVGSGNIATAYSILDAITGATATANAFGACVIDILDPFETTKNKTIKAFSGANTVVGLSSTFWNSTSAVTSVSLTPFSGTNFLTGTRISIYGLKGS
jgi:hypothetical protein